MCTRLALTALTLFLAVPVGACSDDDSGPDPDSAVFADADVDAEVPDAEVPDAGDTIAPEDYRFFLVPSIALLPGNEWQSLVYFHNHSTAIEGRRCAVIESGDCFVRECRIDEVTIGPEERLALHAGLVTVSGGAGSDAVLSPNAAGFYTKFNEIGTASHWSPGEVLTVSAVGMDIPAFSETFTIPTPLDLITPTVDGTPLTIDRTLPLLVEWTPTTDRVTVQIEQAPTGMGADFTDRVEINCEFDGSVGTGTVPAAILGVFDPSSDPTLWQGIYFGHETLTNITPGGYPLRIGGGNGVAVDVVIE